MTRSTADAPLLHVARRRAALDALEALACTGRARRVRMPVAHDALVRRSHAAALARR